MAMSTAPRYVPHCTVADLASWQGDWELLAGVAVAMTPSPFGRHAERLSRMAAVLWNAIDAAGCKATVLAEIDWIVAGDTVVRPDLVVVCGPAPRCHVEQAPALVVEILSAATEFQGMHATFKEKIHRFVMGHFFPSYSFDLDKTLYFFTSGRYEPRTASGRQLIDLCPDCTLPLDLGPG